MELNVYKVLVRSPLYQSKFDIRAKDLQDASRQAKIRFGKKYKVMGSQVKVSLQECDLVNHIEEILNKFVEEN